MLPNFRDEELLHVPDIALAWFRQIHRESVRGDHSDFVPRRRRHRLLPCEDNVEDECVLHHMEHTLFTNRLAANWLLMKDSLSMRSNADLAVRGFGLDVHCS